MKIVFFGSSDDNFCFKSECRKVCDEVSCYEQTPVVKVVDAEGNGLYVVGNYAPGFDGADLPGCWSVGVMQLDEDVPLPPDWTLSITASGYTTHLSIETPGDVRVLTWSEPDEDKSKDWR